MKISVYQINHERDKDRVLFSPYAETLKESDAINPAIYDKVFEGEVNCTNLEDVFRLFNEEMPITHRGHSLSVSDVVEVIESPILAGFIDYLDTNGKSVERMQFTDSNEYNKEISDCIDCGRPIEAHSLQDKNILSVEKGYYYCDSFDFKKIDFDATQAHTPDNLIKVVVVEPNKPAYISEVADDYKAIQRVVGGLFQCTYPFDDDMVVYSNDEAKLIGMDGNRTINDQLYAGPLFIARDMQDGSTGSLTEEQLEKYTEQFKETESYTQDDVEDSIFMTFMSF